MMRRSTPVSSRTPAAGNRSRDLTSFWHPCPALALLAAAIVFVTLCLRLGHLPLLNPDEGRNAEIGREMKESGAWLVPTYNGVVRLDKPTFYFKTVALSLAAFGETETAARLPSALFGLGLLGLVVAFCQRVYGTPTALLAVIVLATMPLYLAQARTVMVDIALAFFVCGGIFAGYFGEETEDRARRRWYLIGAASAGCATLVKGPVGLLLPALVLLVFHRMEGRRGAWKRLFAPANLAVFFIITLPWVVGVCLAIRTSCATGWWKSHSADSLHPGSSIVRNRSTSTCPSSPPCSFHGACCCLKPVWRHGNADGPGTVLTGSASSGALWWSSSSRSPIRSSRHTS